MLLNPNNTVLIVIDVQGKLAQLMAGKEPFFDNLQRLIKGTKVLELPILWTEQVPDKLGPTTPEIAELLQDITQPITKSSFSCYGEPAFMKALQTLNRRQVLLAGIEAHICVYQTALDLLAQGYDVQLVTDAVASRTPENRQIGLDRIRAAGAGLTSTETALFELLRVAEGAKFKEIAKIVK